MDPVTDRAASDLPASPEPVLEIERFFDAPRALVFEMWTKGEHMRHWAVPDGFTVTFGSGDARLGGKWRSAMKGPDGRGLWLSVTYREIDPPHRLVFTHQWDGGVETVISVTLEEIDGRTRMRFRQTGFTSVESRDGHGGGWTESFATLDRYLRGWISADAARAEAPDDGKVLEIERVFDAPRALVFKLWSAPEHIARWWGPQGLYLSHCEMEFREGGHWRFCMMPESGDGHWVHGVYREIRAPERLSFTYTNERDGHDMLETLDFLEQGERTMLKFRQERFFSVAERDSHAHGWGSTFGIFDRYLRLYRDGDLPGEPLAWREHGAGADLKAAALRQTPLPAAATLAEVGSAGSRHAAE